MSPSPRTVGIVLFEGFELLDVFGPVELLSVVPDGFAITYLAASPGPVRSSQGAEVVATDSLSDSLASGSVPDIVLVPGGGGTRGLVDDHDLLDLIAAWASRASVVTSVYRATSNKRAFAWASAQGTDVEWVPHARWAEDRDRWTSSGVAAGMDMTAALIARLVGEEAATTAARTVELEVHSDPDWDPFAEHYGLGM